jgi:hypothetical protein
VKRAFWLLLTVFVISTCLAASATSSSPVASQSSDVGFCKPYVWLFGGFVAAPRLPVLGDINGDGYADFIYASPQEKFIDVTLNGRGWKPLRGVRLISDLPQPIQSLCMGHFGGKTLDMAVLGTDGSIVKILNTGDGAFPAAAPVASVAKPTGKAWLLSGWFGSEKGDEPIIGGYRVRPITDDLVVVNADGKATIVTIADGKIARTFNLPKGIIDAATGDVNGDGIVELVINRGKDVEVYSLGAKAAKLATIAAGKGTEALAVSDINGDGKADVFVNGVAHLAPDFKQSVAIANWDKEKIPVLARMADVTNHGRADLVIQRQGADYYGSFDTDTLLYVTYQKTDSDFDRDGLTNEEEAKAGADPLDRDTDYDGLCDGWEVHGFAGIDFPKLGASPIHKDIFVFNDLNEDCPTDQMDGFMNSYVIPFYAKLAYKNPDGKTGFALHFSDLPKIPKSEYSKKGWGQLGAELLPADKIGFYHWMQVGGMWGGGQSGQLGDAGSTGAWSWVHEFGHQLGLSHSGKWPTWSPTYTSLMNYTYSYSFEGDGAKTHYSNGEFAGLVLDQMHLRKKVPYPIERLKFLSGPPYYFRMKPADNNSTYIDWNWNGIFKDEVVRANITYGYSIGFGAVYQPNGTEGFQYEGPFNLYTDYEASFEHHKGQFYMLTVSRKPTDVGAPRPTDTDLILQRYVGNHTWSKPESIAKNVIGDPFAISDGKTFYVFYPTADGIVCRFGQPDKLSEPQLIAGTKGYQVSAINWKGTIYMFLFKGPDQNIVYRKVDGKNIGPEQDMRFKSTICPGPAVDTIHDQLILGVATPQGGQPYRWLLRRFCWNETLGGFHSVSQEWLGGERSGWAGNFRPTVIFRPDKEFGPEGKVFWISAGLALPLRTAATGFYLAQTMAHKDFNGGWLLWRYVNEWNNTRSGIAAAWHDNDLVVATTWGAGTAGGDCGVMMGYQGMGIGPGEFADFDDISLIANYGMARSIQTFAIMPPEK